MSRRYEWVDLAAYYMAHGRRYLAISTERLSSGNVWSGATAMSKAAEFFTSAALCFRANTDDVKPYVGKSLTNTPCIRCIRKCRSCHRHEAIEDDWYKAAKSDAIDIDLMTGEPIPGSVRHRHGSSRGARPQLAEPAKNKWGQPLPERTGQTPA